MITGINSEDQLVQRTFAEYLEEKLGWESVYAWNQETFGLAGTLGGRFPPPLPPPSSPFQTTPQNITLHIGAIYQECELREDSTCKEYLQVRQEAV